MYTVAARVYVCSLVSVTYRIRKCHPVACGIAPISKAHKTTSYHIDRSKRHTLLQAGDGTPAMAFPGSPRNLTCFN